MISGAINLFWSECVSVCVLADVNIVEISGENKDVITVFWYHQQQHLHHHSKWVAQISQMSLESHRGYQNPAHQELYTVAVI